MWETNGNTACRNPFRHIIELMKGVAMSSRKHRVTEVVDLIREYGNNPDADDIITARTGYSKALIAGLRYDMKSGRFHEEES